MNEGSLVVTTSNPLRKPAPRVMARAAASAGPSAHPKPPWLAGVTSSMIAMPAKPMRDPTDRSNSPAIIRSATATARIPSGVARLRIDEVVAQLTKLLSKATTAKNTQHHHGGEDRPELWSGEQSGDGPNLLTRSSSGADGRGRCLLCGHAVLLHPVTSGLGQPWCRLLAARHLSGCAGRSSGS